MLCLKCKIDMRVTADGRYVCRNPRCANYKKDTEQKSATAEGTESTQESEDK